MPATTQALSGALRRGGWSAKSGYAWHAGYGFQVEAVSTEVFSGWWVDWYGDKTAERIEAMAVWLESDGWEVVPLLRGAADVPYLYVTGRD